MMSLFPETQSKSDSVWQSAPQKKGFFKRGLRFLEKIFCLIGFIVTVVLAVRFYSLAKENSPVVFDEGTILRMALTQELYETRPDDLLGSVTFGNRPTVADVVLGLHRAAKDPNIKALVAYMPDTKLGLAQIQEIREAVKAFRNAGKKTFFYAPTFGELGGGI
ncbi:MAG: hypothetical protein IKR09_05670, partial [Alphaproteobacteria bacterium]|nr:hypothetical protein [Alphaproteobacteria bacterium]